MLPFPFVPHLSNAPSAEFVVGVETDDELLQEFLLYAQARNKGRGWGVFGVFGGLVGWLEVRFHCAQNLVVYIDACWGGFFSIHTQGAEALCFSEQETLRALDALASEMPRLEAEHLKRCDDACLFHHCSSVLRRMEMNGEFDKVRAAALRRKMFSLVAC